MTAAHDANLSGLILQTPIGMVHAKKHNNIMEAIIQGPSIRWYYDSAKLKALIVLIFCIAKADVRLNNKKILLGKRQQLQSHSELRMLMVWI